MTRKRTVIFSDQNNNKQIGISCYDDLDIEAVIHSILENFNGKVLRNKYLIDILYIDFIARNIEVNFIYSEYLNEITIKVQKKEDEPFIEELYKFLKEKLEEKQS